MTEQEAKEKWCPFVRIDTGWRGVAANRIGNTELAPASRCIGSACMAFRSHPAHKIRISPFENEVDVPAQSYCGLAGKP